MKVETQSTRMESLIALYDIQTNYFLQAIEGISDADAHNRLSTKANHVAWLAGSLVEQRYDMAKQAGTELKHTGSALFENYQGIKDDTIYPKLSEYKKDWETISPIFREILINTTDEQLEAIIDMGSFKMSKYELITFMIYREASIIGQIALWRRLLGYDAMKYD